MSDEIPVVSLEDDAPAPVEDTPAQEPAAAAPAEPAAVAEEVDPNAVDLKDEGRVRGLLAELSRKRGETRDLKAKAERADQLEAYVNESKPYVDFLRANPDLLKPRTTPEPKADAPTVDPNTLALAKTLDLYDANGQPDVQRAQTIRSLIDTTAKQHAAAAVQPFEQSRAQQASAANFNHALAIKDANGRSPSKEALTHLWRNMPAEKTADPQVAAMLALTALGYDTLAGKAAIQPPAKPVLETESSGGAPRNAKPMSELETTIAKERGVPAGKWSDLTKGHNSGRSSVLED